MNQVESYKKVIDIVANMDNEDAMDLVIEIAKTNPAILVKAHKKVNGAASWTVELVRKGDKAIQTIKEIRTATGLGLKESKALWDNVPSVILNNTNLYEAKAVAIQLEQFGNEVNVY